MANTVTDKALFQAIFKSSLAGFFIVDADGYILKVNPEGEKMFGYKKGELIQKNIGSLFSDSFKETYKTRIKSTHPRPFQLLALDKAGRTFPLDVRIAPTVIKGRTIASVYCKPSNEALFESDRKLRTLIANVSGIVYRCKIDKPWTMEFISDACYSICGYSPEQFYDNTTVHWEALIHPEDKARVWKEIHESISKKEPYQVTYRILTAENKTKWIWERGSGVIDKTGKIYRLEGFMEDISELKETEIVLAREKQRLHQYLDTAGSIFLVINTAGRIDLVNRKGSEVLGLSIDTIVGKNWFDSFIPKRNKKEILSLFNKVMQGEVTPPDFYENWVVIASGEERLIRWRNAVLEEEEGKITGIISSGVDVTEAKMVQNVLNIRNRALEAAGNGIIIVNAADVNLPIIYSNNAFSKITGYDKEEVLGRNCRFLQNGDREQKGIDVIRKAIKAQKPTQAIIRNYRKDGTLFWNELTITPVHNEKGQLVNFIGVQNDVTERKKGELLKDQIRQILEMIAEHKSLKDIGMAIVEAIEGYLKGYMASIMLLNKKKGTLNKLAAPHLPKPIITLLNGISVNADSCSCTSAARYKKEVVTKDVAKDPLWGDYRKSAMQNGLRSCWSFPILSSRKEVLGTFAIYHKKPKKPLKLYKEVVTDLAQLMAMAIEQNLIRKELEKSRWLLESYARELEQKVAERTNELKATVQKLVETNLSLEDQVLETKAAENRALTSQAMFAAISRNFPKGVIIVFNANFEIVYIDGGELRRLGFVKSQFEGLHVEDVEVFSKERIARIKDDIKKTLAGEHLSFEMRFRNKNYTVNTSPLNNGNNEVKWTLFVYNDITKQKKAEQDIRNALLQEQELNELKSRFISMASHEFRTPLSAILSSAILIEKQNEPGKEKKREKYIEQIKSNVRNLVGILNDFLSLSKLEEGKVASKPVRFDLVQFSKSILEEIRPTKKRGQKINMETNTDPIMVYLDPKLMHHVLVNLISNAIKYSQEDQEVSLSLKAKKALVSVEVKDQGIGIPKAEQDNLFQRFFRADNSTNIQGTGLGLHIVKQYTELMGGTVGFESEVDKGSIFKVEFPTFQSPKME